MGDIELLKDLFVTQSEEINVLFFLIQMILTSILCLGVGAIYVRYGHSASNRKTLSRSFVLIGLTTMIIITIVKSSLALSLGLVGALSIVRFRTAIKEPEELAYFFVVIAVGLGIGAGQVIVTVLGVLGVAAIIWMSHRTRSEELAQNLVITLPASSGGEVKSLTDLLQGHAEQLSLRRIDDRPELTEVIYAINFASPDQLFALRAKLAQDFPSATMSFLELS